MPVRPNGGIVPTTAAELEAMLVGDLSDDAKTLFDVIVFDGSNPAASVTRKSRKKARK